jgi:hypothetical protein
VQAHYTSLGFPDCELATRINAFINDKLANTEGMQMHATMLQKAISTPPNVCVAKTTNTSSSLCKRERALTRHRPVHLLCFLLSHVQRGVAVAAPSSSKFKLRNMSDSISLFDIEELEVAKQLTLRTWDIYCKFQVRCTRASPPASFSL